MKKSLLSLAAEKYQLTVRKHSYIHDTEKTRVLSLETNQGKFILKTLYKPLSRQLFILEAENYLIKKGVHIPKTISTHGGNPYIMWEGHPYILQEWIHGSHYPLKNSERMKHIGALLGRIHRSSLGFCPTEANTYNGSKRWKQTYEDGISFLKSWKTAHDKSKDKKICLIHKHIDYFLKIGNQIAHKCLIHPYFSDWVSLPLESHYLCHGDFHTNNIFFTGSNFYIIDWEDVRYDFPSKDLTRVISYMMKAQYPKWSTKRFERVYSAYLTENPLSPKEQKLLFHDMSFPHILIRYLRKKLYSTPSIEKVEQFILAEQNKSEYMYKNASS